MQAIAVGQTGIRNVLAAVTPGGGKSLLPVIAAAHLVKSGVAERVCWVVPRETLRLQAEEAFADPAWRDALGHAVTVRAADNAPDPCRGLDGYVTTYQAVAAAPELHLEEFRKHRYLLAVDEMHHLPALNDTDVFSPAADEAAWSRAVLPLLETASVRLLMSGTLERADGKPILWLPYRNKDRRAGRQMVRQVDFHAPGWAIVGYSRRQALAERAVIPVTFGAMAGEAEWKPLHNSKAPAPGRPVALSEEPSLAKYALYTALRTEYAETMLRRAFDDCRAHRLRRRAAMGAQADAAARGLGKLLVVASDQDVARRYTAMITAWLPERERARAVRLAVSDVADAHEIIAAFRLCPDPAVLVTVAMAYEGMDVPEVSHVCCLTHIRSRPWLEQMMARATRVDPHGGPWEGQSATVYHPDDLMFRRFRRAIETEQGIGAKFGRGGQGDLFDHAAGQDGGGDTQDWGMGIEPLRSNVTGLRFAVVAPGPDFVSRRDAEPPPDQQPGQGAGPAAEPPSMSERRLRERIGAMVAAQVVEDKGNHAVPGGTPGYHAYNAVLKQVMGGRARSEMTLAELEAAAAWMERNRLSDHLDLIRDDPRYRWSERTQREVRDTPEAWGRRVDRGGSGKRQQANRA
jgi:superfamily II DNA or RNA helicase